MTNDERKILIETEQRSKSNTHSITDLKGEITELKADIKEMKNEQKAIYEINSNIQLMAQSITTVKDEVCDLKKDMGNQNRDLKNDIGKVNQRISAVESKPTEQILSRYNSIKEKVITIIVTGIATYILVQIAPSIFG